MSPDQAGSVAALARLKTELALDRQALQAHERETHDLLDAWTDAPSRGDVARAAVVLHAWYTGLETLLERVVRHLDRAVPAGAERHRELLTQSCATIPHVRPAVLPTAPAVDKNHERGQAQFSLLINRSAMVAVSD